MSSGFSTTTTLACYRTTARCGAIPFHFNGVVVGAAAVPLHATCVTRISFISNHRCSQWTCGLDVALAISFYLDCLCKELRQWLLSAMLLLSIAKVAVSSGCKGVVFLRHLSRLQLTEIHSVKCSKFEIFWKIGKTKKYIKNTVTS